MKNQAPRTVWCNIIWWGCREHFKLITLGSERVKSAGSSTFQFTKFKSPPGNFHKLMPLIGMQRYLFMKARLRFNLHWIWIATIYSCPLGAMSLETQGPVPRSPTSLIGLSRNFPASLFLNMRQIVYQNACIAKWNTIWTALVSLRLNLCSLLDHKSRWRFSLIPD